MPSRRIALLLCCTLLMACNGDKTGTNATVGEDGLPKPAVATGSVTGMPDPGVADSRPVASNPHPADAPQLPVALDDAEVAPAEPTGQPLPVEGTSMPLPEAAVPDDPDAPPPPPIGEAASPTDPNVPRQ